MARRASVILLTLLGIFLLGTVIVLSTVKVYLRINDLAYITELEIPYTTVKSNVSEEIVPRILHQTWKTDVLPKEWVEPSAHCRALMSDYQYMLWTDISSRQLIADHYPWFLPTFDGYTYNIQRADAIRYFVLHRYGGVYMDLDIGCLRPIDPLLKFPVILPITIPVGISNDLMFSTKGHPFMEQVIRGLITFDINYWFNYPTVMFSTGPMFLSVQYGLYTKTHPATLKNPGGDVRVLPKSLYGKNAKPEEVPHSFFEHYYGSSWHSDDAGLWTFLGVWGVRMMYVAMAFLAFNVVRMWWRKKRGQSGGFRGRRLMLGRYEVVLPRFHYDRENGPQLDLGPFSVAMPVHSREVTGSTTASPTSSSPASPLDTPRIPATVMPLSFDNYASDSGGAFADAFRKAGTWVASAVSSNPDGRQPGTSSRYNRRRRSRGILFFLPAIFHPASSSRIPVSPEVDSISLPLFDAEARAQSRSRSPQQGSSKDGDSTFEAVPLMGGRLDAPSNTGSRRSSMSAPPPPPYASSRTLTHGA